MQTGATVAIGWAMIAIALTGRPALAAAPPLRPEIADDTAADSSVQLGAWRSESEAAIDSRKIAVRADEILDDLTPTLMESDVPGKGHLYRLRAGPMDRATATSICERLRARSLDCVVVH